MVDRNNPPQVKVDPTKPEDTLYEQLRSGSFQVGGVIETVEAALEKLREVKPGKDAELKGVVGEVKDALDAAGAALADYDEEPPPRKDVDARFAELDDKRIKAIDAANNALHDLAEAEGVAEEVGGSKSVGALTDVADLLLVAIQDLQDAITTLGGKIEE